MYKNRFFEVAIAYHTETKEPVGSGLHKALIAYNETKNYKLDILAVNDMPFEQDLPDFAAALSNANVREFIISDSSSGLKYSLIYLLNNGWNVVGTYEKQVNEYYTVRGLRMKKSEGGNSNG